MIENDFRDRAEAYCKLDGNRPLFQFKLGSGQEGYVWETVGGSAIKVFERETNFFSERDCYEILKKHQINSINGFNIPEFINSNEDLLVVEMSIVKAPFLLDFGKSYLYFEPKYPSAALDDYATQMKDHFGDMLDEVEEAISILRDYGIFYTDARCGNINCDGWKSQK